MNQAEAKAIERRALKAHIEYARREISMARDRLTNLESDLGLMQQALSVLEVIDDGEHPSPGEVPVGPDPDA